MSICSGWAWWYHVFFFSSRRRHTRWPRDWSSDVCSSDLRSNDAYGFPGLQQAHAERGLASTGNRQIDFAAANHPEGLADSMVGGGASGGNREGGACCAELHGNVAGAGIRHDSWDRKRMDPASFLAIKLYESGVLGGLAADTRTGDHGGLFPKLWRQGHAGVPNCFPRSDNRELSEAIQQVGPVGTK